VDEQSPAQNLLQNVKEYHLALLPYLHYLRLLIYLRHFSSETIENEKLSNLIPFDKYKLCTKLAPNEIIQGGSFSTNFDATA